MEFLSGSIQFLRDKLIEASKRTGAFPGGLSGVGYLMMPAGQTALFFSVQRVSDEEALEISRLVIEEGGGDAFAMKKDDIGQTALFYAASVGNIKTCEYLIRERHLRTSDCDIYGQTPLFYAAREGKVNVLKIPEFAQNASVVDLNGQSALFYAAREGKREVCEELVRIGGDQLVMIRDTMARRASYFARSRSHISLAEDYLECIEKKIESERSSSTSDKEDISRKVYRLVIKSGELTLKDLESFENEFPGLAVWNNRQSSLFAKSIPSTTTSSVPLPAPSKSLSSSIAPTTASQVDWETRAKKILAETSRKPEANIFMRPVDPLKDSCPDYLQIIDKPMDFGSISRKLKSGEYGGDKAKFISDVEQVFKNCSIYNPEGSLPRILARKLESFMKTRLDML